VLTDIQIAQSCKMKPITQVAAELGIDEEELSFTENTKQNYPTSSGKSKGQA